MQVDTFIFFLKIKRQIKAKALEQLLSGAHVEISVAVPQVTNEPCPKKLLSESIKALKDRLWFQMEQNEKGEGT